MLNPNFWFGHFYFVSPRNIAVVIEYFNLNRLGNAVRKTKLWILHSKLNKLKNLA